MPSNKILIIEDEPEISSLLKIYLEKELFSADIAQSGAAALSLFSRNDYTLIILDLMLPDYDGLEICRKIRAKSHIPVIMVTAKDQNPDKVLGLGIGADDYITKPFEISEVIARVKAQLRRFYRFNTENKDTNQTNLSFSGLSIDKNRFEVKKDHKSISLTPKEFELLSFLAEYPGQVFSKQKILNQLWPENRYLDENTLSVHMRRLRKKIETDPDNPVYLHTVWGIGYKFCESP